MWSFTPKRQKQAPKNGHPCDWHKCLAGLVSIGQLFRLGVRWILAAIWLAACHACCCHVRGVKLNALSAILYRPPLAQLDGFGHQPKSPAIGVCEGDAIARYGDPARLGQLKVAAIARDGTVAILIQGEIHRYRRGVAAARHPK